MSPSLSNSIFIERRAAMKIRVMSKILRTTLLVSPVAALLFTFGAFSPRPADATPQFAQQTKLPCGQCHANPSGGGALKSFGQKFKANGYKVK
jgi:hypothetical protein